MTARIEPFDWNAVLPGTDLDGARLKQLQSNSWTLERQLAAWAKWVNELLGGLAPVRDEMIAIYDCRDDLEELLEALDPSLRAGPLDDYMKSVDDAFRDVTEVTTDLESEGWWRARTPRNEQGRNLGA